MVKYYLKNLKWSNVFSLGIMQRVYFRRFQSLRTVKPFDAVAHAFSDKGSSNFTDLNFFNPSII
jgi:hypothetical protein